MSFAYKLERRALSIRDKADRLGNQAELAELEVMEAPMEAYLTSMGFEHMFWDIVYNRESWSV